MPLFMDRCYYCITWLFSVSHIRYVYTCVNCTIMQNTHSNTHIVTSDLSHISHTKRVYVFIQSVSVECTESWWTMNEKQYESYCPLTFGSDTYKHTHTHTHTHTYIYIYIYIKVQKYKF